MTTATYYDQYTVLNLSAYSYAQTSPDLGINLNGSKDFSVDAWVNFNGLCSSTSIIAKEGVFEFGLWGNTVFMQITGYAPAMCDPESTTLDDGDWHYICVTYDTSGGVRFYIDGQFNSPFTSISGTSSSNNNPYKIGSGLQRFVKQVRVFNQGLAAETVLKNMFEDPEASSIVADFDFSQNPPKDLCTGNLPITLEENANMKTKSPSVSLSGTAYAVPYRDQAVNPGGYQTDPYAVQARVYIESGSTIHTQQAIFVNSDLELDSGMALLLSYDSASRGYHVLSQRGSDDILTSSSTIRTREWFNIATTYNGSTLSIYIDGVLSGSKAFGPIPSMLFESNV